jgi:nucleotidyltransferase/DNA polymerase involved in DNA repair
MASRILIHCDLDAFYAAVETLHHNLDPNVPLILGSDPKGGKGRGIVSTCNYAARKYGIRSAMPIGEAWRRCPGAPHGIGHYLTSTRGLYSRASRKVMSILSEYADKFEQASIDEAYLDVTEYCDNDWDKAQQEFIVHFPMRYFRSLKEDRLGKFQELVRKQQQDLRNGE